MRTVRSEHHPSFGEKLDQTIYTLRFFATHAKHLFLLLTFLHDGALCGTC